MPEISVTFLPDGKSTTVDDTQTLLDAAQRAGVALSRVCAGEGLCGRCKVIVRKGDVWAEPTMHLTREEVRHGYVLACKSHPRGDLIVEVPFESRVEGAPRPTEEDAVRFGSPRALVGEGSLYPHEPLARKRFLRLPPPSLQDNVSDQERLFRELRREEGIPILQMGLNQVRYLPEALRARDWEATATIAQRGGTVEVVEVEEGDTSSRAYGVAVDIGTTTVVAHLVDLNNSQTVDRQAIYNSQIQYGEDVISRIMYARTPEQLNRMAACVSGDINNLIGGLLASSGVALHDVAFVLCAGNTTMTHLLLGLDPRAIRQEPYIPVAVTPPVVRAAEVGVKINPRGLLGCVPAVACYVGGDVVAGVLVSGMTRSDEPSLLIDMGTNAEIVVGNRDWMVCCSASAGPTFEGGGISCGMRAMNGAIERMTLLDHGNYVVYSVIGGGKPTGLCGSGLMDAVAEMFRGGCVERSGTLSPGACGRVREGEDGLEFVVVDADGTPGGKEITLTQADLQNFIRSKGAIYHAAECLLAHVGLEFEDLANVYISGGFGNYLDVGKGILTGLLPDLPRERFQFIGNGSVQGAKMMLLSRHAQNAAEEIASQMTYIELSTDPRFMNEYSSALFLPHTDIERFPSVVQELAAIRG